MMFRKAWNRRHMEARKSTKCACIVLILPQAAAFDYKRGYCVRKTFGQDLYSYSYVYLLKSSKSM